MTRYEIDYVTEMCQDLPVRVVDGDTWYAYQKVPFRGIPLVEFRLVGWDCPEKQSRAGITITQFERARAREAQSATLTFFTMHRSCRILVRTEPDPEKYQRWLGDPWCEGHSLHLGDALANESLAVPYYGRSGEFRWRHVYDPTYNGR